MKILSETLLLKSIRQNIPPPDARVLVGFGDDAACYKIPSGKFSSITTDAFVENVHFSLQYFSFSDIGAKSLSAAISDIAAIGGIPSVAVLSLFIREGIKKSEINELYKSVKETAKKYWVNIVGGDIVKAEELAIVFTIVGEIDKSNITLRSGAQVGDIIFVTGNLGGAYTGRLVLERGLEINAFGFQDIAKKHLRPEARVDESQKLIKNLKINSMIDISDGLSTDLLHIAEESRVSVQIEASRIPISEETKRAASLFKLGPIETALRSGEEYELLFTVSPKETEKIKQLDLKIPVTPIGKITSKEEKNVIIFPDGTKKPLIPTGYVHIA